MLAYPVFRFRQFDGHIAHEKLLGGQIDPYLVEDERRVALPAFPPQVRGHLGPQLRRAERLSHVIVAADGKARDGIVFLGFRREEHDGAVAALSLIHI